MLEAQEFCYFSVCVVVARATKACYVGFTSLEC